jgi:hypothetical protein
LFGRGHRIGYHLAEEIRECIHARSTKLYFVIRGGRDARNHAPEQCTGVFRMVERDSLE